MPSLSTAELATAADHPGRTNPEIEEEVKYFAARFARLVVSRAFREGADAGGAEETVAAAGGTSGATAGGVPVGYDSSSSRSRSSSSSSALEIHTAEAEISLRESQRLVAQMGEDAGLLRSRVFPALLENARRLHALYVAIDRLSEEVVPGVEATVGRMEKALYDLEELRKEQVEARTPCGSFGLGVALGAGGLWSVPPTREEEEGVAIPEVFDTDEVFRVKEGGLAPL